MRNTTALYFVLIIVVFVIAGLLITSLPMQNTSNDNTSGEVATFAAGCFWCTEAAFQETPGVLDAVSGYIDGETENPTYEDVYTQRSGHREALQVTYDPEVISYEELLDIFWKSIDPTDAGGQFVDRGHSYTTAIYYHNDEQKKAAEKSYEELNKLPEFKGKIATEILPYSEFYQAEEYHQDFYKKQPQRYKSYSENSGREEFKQQVWEQIEMGAE